MGILQTPQYFQVDPANWVEQGAAEQQEVFYRLVQRARDHWRSTICVGTNAVYRRSALASRGGVALIEHSEDVFTGLKVMDAGYRVGYLPLILAAGSSPTDVRSLSSQQYRWARGTFALVGTSLFRRVRLTPRQRLSYWDGWAYYVAGAMAPVAAVLLPVLSLVEAPGTITLRTAMLGVPALVMGLVVAPRWHLRHEGSSSRRVGLLTQVAHLCALVDHAADRDQEWVPTGGSHPGAGTGAERRYRRTDHLVDFCVAAAVATFAAVLALCILRISQGASPWDLAPVAGYTVFALVTALGTLADPIHASVLAAREQDSAPAIEPAPKPTPPAKRSRDVVLDLIRAVSVVRVVCWHAFGFWWISWTFSAMPAVFYVSGAVLLHSRRRRRHRDVVISRYLRLLPPYLAFVGVGLVAAWLASPTDVSHHLLDVVGWLVPVARTPAALSWEGGWLSSPLWFIRALLLVLVVAPLLVRPVARLPWAVSIGGWLAVLVAFDLVVANQHAPTATALWRGAGDVACYGGFFILGALFHNRREVVSRRVRLLVVAVTAAAAVVATVVAPPPDWVVNNSYTLSALVGLSWLFLALSFEDALRRFGQTRLVHAVVVRMNASSLTIYLWHTLAICTTYWLVGPPSSLADYLTFATVLVLAIVVVVRAAHPVEVLAAGRRPALRLGSVSIVVLVLAAAVVRPNLFPHEAPDAAVPPPSGRPLVGATAPASDTPRVDGEPAVGLKATGTDPNVDDAEGWVDEHGVEGAVAIVAQATGERVVALGDWGLDAASEQFQVTSVTKTMVAAVALQLVEEGRLTLDGPLPAVDGVPSVITDELTLRRLLAHATGLVDYRDAAGYREDLELTPRRAITLALASSDVGSTEVEYGATNYLVVGLLLEHVTGEPLDRLLDERIFGPNDMSSTRLVRNDRPGFVGHASGGVVSTVEDLTRWYVALMRDQTVLSPAMLDEMLTGGSRYATNVGLGAWERCPCATASDGSAIVEYVFHDGGDVRLAYHPSDRTVIAMRLSSGLYGPDRLGDQIDVPMGEVLADVKPEPVPAP